MSHVDKSESLVTFDDTVITNASTIAREQASMAAIVAEDAARHETPDAHARMLHGFGIEIRFLLFLTFELDLWNWTTNEVVHCVIKPATEHHGRCRFAELEWVQPFTGPATVFASHCWSGQWGPLVAAMCAGADTRRVVWIDVFAVRQWSGNHADINFRGVVDRCEASIVAVAPAPGVLTDTYIARVPDGVSKFLDSAEYKDLERRLPFFRLWCLVEMAATILKGKGLVFTGSSVLRVVAKERRVVLDPGSSGMISFLENCAWIIDVRRAACRFEEDRIREMKTIEENMTGGVIAVNKIVASAIRAGKQAPNAHGMPILGTHLGGPFGRTTSTATHYGALVFSPQFSRLHRRCGC